MARHRAAFSALPLLFLAATAIAAPGDLDPSFGFGGNLVLFAGSRAASAIVALPDGRFLVGGTENLDAPPAQGFSLARLTANGMVDSTFGSSGFAGAAFGGYPGTATSLLRQPDDMVVQAGSAFTLASGPVFAAARYDADGNLDSGFGIGGRALVDFPGTAYDEARALGRQSDGTLVLAGYVHSGGADHVAMARLETDGSLDATFGTNGLVDMLPAGATFARALAMVVLPDDRLIVAGEASGTAVLMRFTADGALDPTFAVGGVATKGPGWSFGAVARRSDGALVAAGTGQAVLVTGPITYPVAARFDAEGAPDPTFGSGGFVDLQSLALDTAKNYAVSSIVAAADGSIVLGGSVSTTATDQRFALFRLTPTGGLDGTFGPSNGTATGPSGHVAALVQQSDGKLVGAGSRTEANGENAAVIARFFGAVCGNGMTEPDEACDDGNLTSGDGCDANCTPTVCGNGVVAAGEACDDGNVADGDCCTSTCTLDASGAACTADFSLCTNDACDGAGTCVHTYAPAPTCTAPSLPGAAALQVTTAKRRVQWKWLKGGATPPSALGTPTTTTAYALCIYDHEGGVPQLELETAVAGGAQCSGRPCWKATSRGFSYKDKLASHAGIYAMQLVADPTAGKSKVTFKGKGSGLPYLPLPFAQAPNVVVQLRNSVGGCWGSTFGTAKRNDAEKFAAKSD